VKSIYEPGEEIQILRCFELDDDFSWNSGVKCDLRDRVVLIS